MALTSTAERPRSASATPIDRARRQREDQRLMRRVQTGDGRAREELIERYMPLSRSLALRYRRASEPLDDLIQVASVGLVKAVDRWDPERGLAFSSYAVPTILGELRRYFRDSTWDVRPARDLQELCLALEEARESLWGELGRQPTVADLAARLDRQPEEIVEALQATEGRSVRSLDAPVHDEENDSASAGDLLGSEDEEFRPRRGRRHARAPDRHPRRARAGDPAAALQGGSAAVRDRRGRRLLADARVAHHPLLAREALRLRLRNEGRIVPLTLEVPQPSEPATPAVPPEPATPAVPAEPSVPADPVPGPETPPAPDGPDIPPPADG